MNLGSGAGHRSGPGRELSSLLFSDLGSEPAHQTQEPCFVCPRPKPRWAKRVSCLILEFGINRSIWFINIKPGLPFWSLSTVK